MKKIINVGLAGFGLSGQAFHAPFIITAPGFRLAKVLERTTEKSKKLYPEVKIVRDFSGLLEDTDLIIITTPNIYHYDMAKSALLEGKHVILEKPFTVTSDEAAELLELSRQKNVILSVYHNRRFDGDFMTVKKIVQNRMLGELVEYESHFDRFRNQLKENTWKEEPLPGSGILYDLGSHLIDQALTLFSRPETVFADIRKQREKSAIDDNFELILGYEKLKVTLKAGMLVREAGPRYILHGTEGSFIKYGLDPQEEMLRKGVSPLTENWGTEPPGLWGTLNTQVNSLHFTGKVETIPGNYSLYYKNIYEAIVNKAELEVKPEQAMDNIRIIELAEQSSREGRKIIINDGW